MTSLHLIFDAADAPADSFGCREKTETIRIGDLEIKVSVEGIPADATDELRGLRDECDSVTRDRDYWRSVNLRNVSALREAGDKYDALNAQYDALRIASDPAMVKVREAAKTFMLERPGQHIAAIIRIREISSLGLKPAKDLADSIRDEINREKEAADAAL